MKYVGAESWAETVVTLPAADFVQNQHVELVDVISQVKHSIAAEKSTEAFVSLPLRKIFQSLPFAVLELNRTSHMAPAERN
jgi:hypothetical protein